MFSANPKQNITVCPSVRGLIGHQIMFIVLRFCDYHTNYSPIGQWFSAQIHYILHLPPVPLFQFVLPSVYFQWLCPVHSGCIIITVIPCPHTQIPEHYRPRSLSGSHQVMTLCVCCVAWHVAMTSFLMNDPFANIQPHTICCDTPQSVPSWPCSTNLSHYQIDCLFHKQICGESTSTPLLIRWWFHVYGLYILPTPLNHSLYYWHLMAEL